MTNVIFVIKHKQVSLEAIMQGVENSIYKDEISVFFACEKNNSLASEFESKKKGWKVPAYLLTYPQGTTTDEMLDNSICVLTPATTVIVRDECTFYTSVRLDMLISEYKQGGNVVMFSNKSKKGRVWRFIKKQISKLCGKLFAFESYNGDIGMMLFCQEYTDMLIQYNGVAMSKINRFVLSDIRYINAEIENTKIKERKLKKPIVKAVTYFSLTAGTITLSIILNLFVNISIVFWVLIVLLISGLLVMWLYSLLNLYIMLEVGSLKRHRIDYVKLFEKEKVCTNTKN